MIVQELFSKLGLQIDPESWSKGEVFMGRMKTGFQALIAVLAVKKVEDMVMSVIELGGKLNDTAQKTGVAVESLQYYGYVAKLNSSSAESFSHAITKLSRGLAESAKGGSGPAVDGLKKLGLSLNDPKFKNSTIDQKVQRIAEQLSALPDGTKKTAIAMQLFGRSGAELIPTLNDLGKNGTQLKKEFEDFGGVLTEKNTSALDEVGDNIDKVKTAMGGLKNTVVVALLPIIQEMVTSLLEWVKANRAIIAWSIKRAIEIVIDLFNVVAKVVTVAVKALGYVVQAGDKIWTWLQAHDKVMQSVLIVLATAITVFAVQSAIAFVSFAAAAVAAWIVAFGPVIAVGLVLAGLILVIQDVWESITTGKGVAADVFRYVQDVIGGWWDWLGDLLERIGRGFGMMWDGIKGAAKAAFDWIINLPVIKQLIDLFEYFTNRGSQGPPPEMIDPQRTQYLGGAAANDRLPQGSSMYPLYTPSAAAQTVTVGPTTVHVTMPTADPAAVGAAVKGAIQEHWDTAMIHTKGAVE